MGILDPSTARSRIITACDNQNGWQHYQTWLLNPAQRAHKRFVVELGTTTLPTNPGRRRPPEGLAVETRAIVTSAYRITAGDTSDGYQDALDALDDLRANVLGIAKNGGGLHVLYDGSERTLEQEWLICRDTYTLKHRV